MTESHDKILLRGSGLTNVGRVRAHNEDNIHLWKSSELLLAIVADGMGGAAAGEEASRIAVETIMDHLAVPGDLPLNESLEIPEEELSQAVQAANLSIIQEALDHPRQKGMGTTLTMVFVNGHEARFAHVGDSRAYRVNAHGTIEQITSDHSFVQALLDAGHITEEQAETHPMSNVLYRALGQTQDLDVDTYHAELRVGDKLVLCSDGLTRHVRSQEIAALAVETNDPDDIAGQLIQMANARGGEDNISVIVIVVGTDEQIETAKNLPEERDEVQEVEVLSDDDTMLLSSQPTTDGYSTTVPYHDDRRESYEPQRPSSLPESAHSSLSQTGPYQPYNPEGQDKTYPK